jgi:hypothetical protein
MPRWLGPPLSFDDQKAKILARPDCGFDEVKIGTRTGGRFVRALDKGKARYSAPFFPDSFGRMLSPATVDSFCKALDLNPNDFGVDDDWSR